MKKVFLILILGIFLLQSVFAIDLNVEKISDGESIVLGLESPAIFTLNVTNNGPNDKFLFYTFFGMGIEPSEAIEIKSGEIKSGFSHPKIRFSLIAFLFSDLYT